MNWKADFYRNRATEGEVADYLLLCDSSFVPPLRSQVDIRKYARKIYVNATRFEAWAEGSLVGLVAIYCNDTSHHFAHITSVSVLPGSQGSRIASYLMERCLAYLGELEFEYVELEVDRENGKAIHMYERHGFMAAKSTGRNLVMGSNLERKLSNSITMSK